MKRWIEHEGEIKEVEFDRELVKYTEVFSGVRLAIIGGKPVLFRVRNSGDGVVVETPEVEARLRVYRFPPTVSGKAKDHRVQNIKSPMPALVVAVEKKEGDEVKRGDTVVVIEAMKMRTQLKARIDGVVKHVYVRPGMNVGKGQLLAVVESE